jgi:glycosyltransferase involved in cell wall biosynthesis
MLISVIICTIRRVELVRELLDCLQAQAYRNVEILVVGGSDPALAAPYAATVPPGGLPLRFVTAGRGLARARNAGLAQANGDLVCFFDDDVRIGPEFLERVVTCLADPEMSGVGGITAYDVRNYSCNIPFRWRLRRWFGITPSLAPGYSTRLGRSIPFSFLRPFSGHREVHWLPGFCQIFRREAIGDLKYDEVIEVEDRDFSMNVARHWRLAIIGDLKIEHRRDEEARYDNVRQTWRASFGLGRSFAKRRESFFDSFRAAHLVAGEFVLDVLTAVAKPSPANWRLPFTRVNAFVAGYRSLRLPQ